MRYVYASAAFGLFVVDPVSLLVATCFIGAFVLVAYALDSYSNRHR